MGEVQDFLKFIKASPNCSDAGIVDIINPPLSERNRDDKLDPSDFWLPGISQWRLSQSAGQLLNTDQHMVRCNHFQVDTQQLPAVISHYNVSIFKYNRDETLSEEDLAKANDKKLNTKLLKTLHESMGDWQRDQDGRPIGITYDGNSSLFSSVRLPMKGTQSPDLAQRFVKDVCLLDSTTLRFCVVLTNVGEISPPPNAKRPNAADYGNLSIHISRHFI